MWVATLRSWSRVGREWNLGYPVDFRPNRYYIIQGMIIYRNCNCTVRPYFQKRGLIYMPQMAFAILSAKGTETRRGKEGRKEK